MTHASKMPSADANASSPRFLGLLGLAVASAGMAVYLVVFAGARLDAATAGLVVGAAALAFCLTRLHRMVHALARPGRPVEPRSVAGTSRLREEKRRLLRALHELKFDYEMGKLSESDYTSVRETYELRAVEVMRELDGAAQLHPGVGELLENRGVALPLDVPNAAENRPPQSEAGDDGVDRPAGGRGPSEVEEARVCPACGGANDVDAKFCKRCGEGLAQ